MTPTRTVYFLALLMVLAWAPATAAPRTPSSDDEVLLRLPYRLAPAARAQQASLAHGALTLSQALQLAHEAIARSRRFGDPRELGLAQAALAPWWSLPAPPAEVRLLRATLRQSQHDFAAALADLGPLAQPDPLTPPAVQAQALLTQATVLQVTGQLDAARASCQELASARFAALGAGVAGTAQVCLQELRSLRGQPQEAEAALAALAPLAARDGRSWLALVRAELAERRGDPIAAQALYRRAVQGPEPADVYARAAYADWLLQGRRHSEVLALLPEQDAQADALLLRRAIALGAVQSPQAPALAQTLAARFAAARARGDSTHVREEARMLLDVAGQPAAALVLAQDNWRRQKEPADALLLARAALAAGQPQALAPLRAFVQSTGWADARLVALDRSLRP